MQIRAGGQIADIVSKMIAVVGFRHDA
jgi:hypothetical protein